MVHPRRARTRYASAGHPAKNNTVQENVSHADTGRAAEAHTGTTPYEARADAMLLAARMIVHAQHLAAAKGALASAGIVTARPGSVNTIPGRVRFSLDLRAPLDATVDAIEAALRHDFEALARGEATAFAGPPLRRGRPLSVAW